MVGVITASGEMSPPAPAHPLRQWVRMVGVKTKTDEMSSPAPVSSDRRGHQTTSCRVAVTVCRAKLGPGAGKTTLPQTVRPS